MKHCLFFILLLSEFGINAQNARFIWEYDRGSECSYFGDYDTTKYSKRQIEDTYRLGFSDDSLYTQTGKLHFSIVTLISFDVEDSPRMASIIKLKLDSLEKEYKDKSAEVQKLVLIQTQYWENLRQQKLNEFKQVYELKKLILQNYFTPCAMLKYDETDSSMKKHENALCKGGKELLSAWKDVFSEQCNNLPDYIKNDTNRFTNNYITRLIKEFQRKYNSPQRMEYAKNEVFELGWWYHAKMHIQYAKQASLEEYEKAFVYFRCGGCD